MNENNEKNTPVTLNPRVDIYENEKEVVLVADMPGVSENDVDIDLQRNCLTIKGSRTFTPEEGWKMASGEFHPAYCYERQFTLGETIDADSITASMKDGVLKLTLPKTQEPAPRKIRVNA